MSLRGKQNRALTGPPACEHLSLISTRGTPPALPAPGPSGKVRRRGRAWGRLEALSLWCCGTPGFCPWLLGWLGEERTEEGNWGRAVGKERQK